MQRCGHRVGRCGSMAVCLAAGVIKLGLLTPSPWHSCPRVSGEGFQIDRTPTPELGFVHTGGTGRRGQFESSRSCLAVARALFAARSSSGLVWFRFAAAGKQMSA